MKAGPCGPVLNQLTRRQLGLQRVPNRRRRRGLRRRTILFNLLALDLPHRRAVAQADAPRLRADLDDLEIVFLARFERTRTLQRSGGRTETRVPFVTALALLNFRVVAKRFDVFTQFDERAERGDARNLALHDLPDLVLLEPVAPDVVDLLDAQRHTAVLGINLQHLGGDVFAFLEHLVRVLDAFRPAHIADVHKPVEAILDFDERAKLRNVPHFAGDDCAHRILLRNQQPGIRLGLLDTQRNAPVARLDIEHNDIHFIADFGDLRRMLDLLVPTHLRHVYQAFDTLFQLHEHAVVHDSDDLALHLPARRILFRCAYPRIGDQLLHPQRDALLFLVKLQNDDVDFLFRLYHVRRMLHAAPAQVRQVQQAVDSAKVHERAILGDVLHFAMHDLAFAQRLHQLGALGVQLFLQQGAAAHHHVAAASVQLCDAHLDFCAGQVVQVLHWPQVLLRTGQECAHTDIHHDHALDAVHHFLGNCFLSFERGFDLFPRAAAQYFQVRQDREAVLVFPGALHFDRAVRLGPRDFRVREFRRGNQAFRLSPQVHHHAMFRIGDT